MKIKNAVLLLLLITCSVFADEAQDRDEFIAQYTQIVDLLEAEDWETLSQFESPNIKCGFGSEDEGAGCIEKLILLEPECKPKMLNALYQGCFLTEGEQALLNCEAPPQSRDPNVLMPLSARVFLEYNVAASQASITYFVCGAG